MTVQEILTLARYQLDDEQPAYKWSNAELIVYLNMALHEMCRRCYLLRDTTTTAHCRITLATNVAEYALSNSIFHIDNAKVAGETAFMTRRTAKELDTKYSDWRNDTAGLPTEFLTDYQTGYITVRPKPSVTYNGTYLWLALYRTPTTDIANSAAGLASTPEINSGYHPYLADYLIGKAFSKPGQLTFSQFKSQYHLNNWEMNLGKVQTAEWRLKRIETQEIASADEGNS